jgi:hypothetical protein
MNKVLVDIVDDLRSMELSPKGWNYVGTALLILAGIYWGSCSCYGDFFKVTGCISYLAAAAIWVKNSAWGQWCLENLLNDDDMVPFIDEK